MSPLLAAAVGGRGLVDPNEPVFFADDEALLRGAAAFETVRIRGGVPVLLDGHVDRLVGSAVSLRLPAPEGAADLARVAAAAAAVDEGVVRLFYTGRTLVATVSPLPPGLDALRTRGITVVTSRSIASGLLTGVKATSYAANLAAVAEAERQGADDALFLTTDGTVLELTMANIWWRNGDVLSTPSLSTGVLPGVTRSAVMRVATELGYRVQEGEYPLASVLAADEAFTSSAVREVLPIVAIDGHELPRGEAARRVQAALEALR